MKAVVQPLARELGAVVEEVNIAGDPELESEYGLQIPVLLINGRKAFKYRLTERELRSVVQSAYVRPYPYTYGCHDEVIRSFCPYVGRLGECDDYRAQHPRSGRDA